LLGCVPTRLPHRIPRSGRVVPARRTPTTPPPPTTYHHHRAYRGRPVPTNPTGPTAHTVPRHRNLRRDLPSHRLDAYYPTTPHQDAPGRPGTTFPSFGAITSSRLNLCFQTTPTPWTVGGFDVLGLGEQHHRGLTLPTGRTTFHTHAPPFFRLTSSVVDGSRVSAWFKLPRWRSFPGPDAFTDVSHHQRTALRRIAYLPHQPHHAIPHPTTTDGAFGTGAGRWVWNGYTHHAHRFPHHHTSRAC